MQTLKQATITAGNYDLEYDIEYYYNPCVKAKLWGSPEDCYPAEPCEIDFQKITLECDDFKIELDEIDFTKSVLKEIKRKIQEREEQ
jgi:hypothetical protein